MGFNYDRMCRRKKRMTEFSALRSVDLNQNTEVGLHAYECPFSVKEYHWHTGHQPYNKDNPHWWDEIQAEALAEGCLGLPERKANV